MQTGAFKLVVHPEVVALFLRFAWKVLVEFL
jgi:hypothetical protein